MASYHAYKWIPWQLFCSKTVAVGGVQCFTSAATSAYMSSTGTEFSSIAAIGGLWLAANKVAYIYLSSLPNLDIGADITITMDIYLNGSAVTGETMTLPVKYATISKGPSGTNLASVTQSTLNFPFTVGANASLWQQRIFTLDDEYVIPANTFTNAMQGLLLGVVPGPTPGNLVTSTRVAFLGFGIHYSSLVMVN
jgi:hypothetical protein